MKKISNLPKLDGELGWFETCSQREEPFDSPLFEEKNYDYVVVGGGFTGVAVCARLAELNPKASIALIDALKIGQGTSGRNAGFIIDLPHNLDSDKPDIKSDTMLFKLNSMAIELLNTRRKSFQVDCDWHRVGKYLAAHESKHINNLEKFTKSLESLKVNFDFLSQEELKKRLGTDYYKAAIYTSGNVLMNPAALVRGIALGLSDRIDVYEQSAITDIEYGELNTLLIGNNKIIARNLVFATNSFTEEFGLVHSKLAPVFTYASLSEPLSSEQLQHFSGIEPWGLTSAHPAGTTVRLTPDNRIFIRNSFHFNSKLFSEQSEIDKAKLKHRESFDKRFPQLKGLPFEYSWGGMLCITGNSQSLFKAVRDNVFVVAGMNGVGVAKGTYMGHYMAEYISGVKSENLSYILKNSNPSWMPPDPIRSLGVRVRLAFEEKMAGGEN